MVNHNGSSLGTIDIDSITEGEAILADRACRRLLRMSLREVFDKFNAKGMKLSNHIFESWVLAGALFCNNNNDSHYADNNTKTKILSHINSLEKQLDECKESLSILESKQNRFCLNS